MLQGEEEALFVDPAVYSRNRAFRLYLSSKAGKQVGGQGGSLVWLAACGPAALGSPWSRLGSHPG